MARTWLARCCKRCVGLLRPIDFRNVAGKSMNATARKPQSIQKKIVTYLSDATCNTLVDPWRYSGWYFCLSRGRPGFHSRSRSNAEEDQMDSDGGGGGVGGELSRARMGRRVEDGLCGRRVEDGLCCCCSRARAQRKHVLVCYMLIVFFYKNTYFKHHSLTHCLCTTLVLLR